MRGELKKTRTGRRGGGGEGVRGGGEGEYTVVACGQALEYSENLGASCTLGDMCARTQNTVYMEMKDGLHCM